MQTRARNALALGAAAALTAAGLGAVAHYRRAPDLRAQVLDAIPSDAFLVARADLAALRASPVGAPLLRYLTAGRDTTELGRVRDVCGFDPMDTITELAVAIPAAGDAGEFGLVAAGPLDDEALLACASRIIDARGGRAVTTTVGSFRSVRDAALAVAGGEIAVRRGGPLLLGAGAYLRSMIDAADGRSPSIHSSLVHAVLGREIGGASVRVVVVLTPEQRRTLAEELESDGEPGSPAASIRAGGLGVELGQTVSLHALVTCENSASCARLARTLGERRDAHARDPALRRAGLDTVLERLEIVPRGELVDARVGLPVEQAARFVQDLLAPRGAPRQPPAPPAGHDEADPQTPGPGAEPPRPDESVTPDAGAQRGPAHHAGER